METITPAILADELIGAAPPLSAREQHLAVSLYRLLAEGSLSSARRWPIVPGCPRWRSTGR